MIRVFCKAEHCVILGCSEKLILFGGGWLTFGTMSVRQNELIVQRNALMVSSKIATRNNSNH